MLKKTGFFNDVPKGTPPQRHPAVRHPQEASQPPITAAPAPLGEPRQAKIVSMFPALPFQSEASLSVIPAAVSVRVRILPSRRSSSRYPQD